jgi:hypothetical protein
MRRIRGWLTRHGVLQPLSSKEAGRVRDGLCPARGYSPTGSEITVPLGFRSASSLSGGRNFPLRRLVGHLEPWPTHLLLLGRPAFLQHQRIQWTGSSMQVPLREVEIASGFFQIVMA